jgi:Ca-activated chloride channel homolog
MRLSSGYFIIALGLIPLLHAWWSHRSKPAALSFSQAIPLNQSEKDPIRILLYLRYLALFFVVIALARPQNSFKFLDRNTSGIDIMMVMDVSASMNIEDLAERSRLEVAKDTMESFIRGRSSDRIGLIAFSGEPMTLAPATLDYGLLTRGLKQIKIGVLKDGTAIGDGLSLALSHLRTSHARSRVVILLTDGDNNIGQINPATAGELAAGYGVKVYTIAIGREGRVKMPIRQQGIFGNVVTTYQWFDNALNPELLKQIAEKTNGKFYRVTDESALESVFKEIDQLEKTDIKIKEKVHYEEMFHHPLKVAFFILILTLILERVWWRIAV